MPRSAVGKRTGLPVSPKSRRSGKRPSSSTKSRRHSKQGVTSLKNSTKGIAKRKVRQNLNELMNSEDFEEAISSLAPLSQNTGSEAYETSQSLSSLCDLLANQKSASDNLLKALRASSQRTKDTKSKLKNITVTLNRLKEHYDHGSINIENHDNWDTVSVFSVNSTVPLTTLENLEEKLKVGGLDEDRKQRDKIKQERSMAKMEKMLQERDLIIEDLQNTMKDQQVKHHNNLKTALNQLKSLAGRIQELEKLLNEKDRIIKSQQDQLDVLSENRS
ncbi:hypothetical protein PCE1_003236 [Barthelona sp. PCE]